MSYFRIWKDAHANYRLTLKGGNHEIIFTTEGYVTKQSALNAMRIVIDTSSYTQVVDAT